MSYPPGNESAISFKQALAQDRSLFVKRTWASATADILKEIGASHIFQHLQKDDCDEAYEPAPPWEIDCITFTVHSLPGAKNTLDRATLLTEAHRALLAVTNDGADVYFNRWFSRHQHLSGCNSLHLTTHNWPLQTDRRLLYASSGASGHLESP
ncbi:hypothetical protein E2C01_082950 [Portunus trituberculatus]|uniref:Uncharacterized protein n=1 Tax=Portunus trituberculatus TaxID=210409 RepID=A0A5B7ITL9_PORTR|nr:hypothetical protein [Portunus trituberculatus]